MAVQLSYVVALGASTPVGRNAWSSAAAVRAGVAGFRQHPRMIDAAGAPMQVAYAPWLDVAMDFHERLLALLCPAIDQVLEPLRAVQGEIRTAVAIALPSVRPGFTQQQQDEFVASIKRRYHGVFTAFAWFPRGHAAGLLALEAACRRLEQEALDACVVAGVDSYLAPETLEWLEQCDQLHGAGRLNNAWGFIPGEAAGALLVVREGVMPAVRAAALAQVLATASAVEEKRIKTETVCIGEGLTNAFRSSLQRLPAGERVTDVYCDMNGEPYRADEYGFTCLRTKEYFESATQFVAPADCWGDVAAASGPLHVALATIAGVKRYARGPVAFIWASSEEGNRAATILRVPHGDADAG